MDIEETVKQILKDTLSLNERGNALSSASPLLGALPELDSMALVNVLAALEDRFDITVDRDELGGESFATVGALTAFVREKIGN